VTLVLRGDDAGERVPVAGDCLLELLDGPAADAARPQALELFDAATDPVQQALDVPLPLGRIGRGHGTIIPALHESRLSRA
jgi:hypothetical protein